MRSRCNSPVASLNRARMRQTFHSIQIRQTCSFVFFKVPALSMTRPARRRFSSNGIWAPIRRRMSARENRPSFKRRRRRRALGAQTTTTRSAKFSSRTSYSRGMSNTRTPRLCRRISRRRPRTTRGWTKRSNRRRRAGFRKTRRAIPARSREPSERTMSFPKSRRTARYAPPEGSSARRARASASAVRAPSFRNIRSTVDLPDPNPPVRPIMRRFFRAPPSIKSWAAFRVPLWRIEHAVLAETEAGAV